MGRTIVEIKVPDVEKRKIPSKHYVYVIYVTWSDGSTNIIYRRYSRFFDFQTKIMDMFPEEAGSLDPRQRIIPFLPGKKFFGRSHIREVAVKRQGPISEYCQAICELPSKISQCRDVIEFFELEPDDINPPKGRKKASMKANKISVPKALEQYVGIADYTKQEKGELTVRVGMLVEVVDKTESGWWFVNVEEEQGWVPSTCLERQDGVKEDSTQRFKSGEEEQYLCTEEFRAESEDEIALERGAVVDVVEKNLEGWWLVRYGGKEGYVPATFLIKSDAFRKKKQKLTRTSGGPEIVKSLREVSDLLREDEYDVVNDVEEEEEEEEWEEEPVYTIHQLSRILKEDKRGTEETEKIYETIEKSKSRSLKRGKSVRPPPRPSIRPQKKSESPVGVRVKPELVRTSSLSRLYTTIAEFQDSVGDGISFKSGEEVRVLEKAEGGWWYIQIGHLEGWAPSTYIQEVPGTSPLPASQTQVPAPVTEEEEPRSQGPRASSPHLAGSQSLGDALKNKLKQRGGMNVPPPPPPGKATPELKPEPAKPTPPAPPKKTSMESKIQHVPPAPPVKSGSDIPSWKKGCSDKPDPVKKISSAGAKTDTHKPVAFVPPAKPNTSQSPAMEKPSAGLHGKFGQQSSSAGPPVLKKVETNEPKTNFLKPAPPVKSKIDTGRESPQPAAGITGALMAKFESNQGPSPSRASPPLSKPKPPAVNKYAKKPGPVSTGTKPAAGGTGNKPPWMKKQTDQLDTETPDGERRKSVSDLANVLKSKFENRQPTADEGQKSDSGRSVVKPSNPSPAPGLKPSAGSNSPGRPGHAPQLNIKPKLPEFPATKKSHTARSNSPARPPSPVLATDTPSDSLDPKKYSSRPLPPKPAAGEEGKPGPGSKPIPSLPSKPGRPAVPHSGPEKAEPSKPSWQKGASKSSEEMGKPGGVQGLKDALKAKLEGNFQGAARSSNVNSETSRPKSAHTAGKLRSCSPELASQSKISGRDDLVNNNVSKEGSVQRYRAIADFSGDNEGEVSLCAGQEVKVLETTDDWWYVAYEDVEGWAPSQYLEAVTATQKQKPTAKPVASKPKAKQTVFRTVSDFIAENEGEVGFSAGQEVTVVDRPEGGWWYIKVGRDEGWAPSSYLDDDM